MAERAPSYATVASAFRESGLIVRGGFHPVAGDGVPGKAGTLILIGNAGPELWERFEPVAHDGDDPLDHWSKQVIDAAAAQVGAVPLYPFDGPPFMPFQRWAQKADSVYPSPIGMLIHPGHGLWHAYRGALVFAARIDLPQSKKTPSPCVTCVEKPCLTTCPVAAFDGVAYDVRACAEHLRTAAGVDCLSLGCRARRNCPIGTAQTYAPRQAEFHMRAFMRAQD